MEQILLLSKTRYFMIHLFPLSQQIIMQVWHIVEFNGLRVRKAAHRLTESGNQFTYALQ